MMHVVVHDQDALPAPLLLRVARRDRDVVEEAESHRLAWAGVVSGRAHERIGVAGASLADGVERDERRSRGQRGGGVAAGREVDIGGEAPWRGLVAVTLHQPLDEEAHLLDVLRRVDGGQLLQSGGTRVKAQQLLFGERAVSDQPIDHRHGEAQPFGNLGELVGHEVVEHGRVIDQRGGQARSR